MVRVLKIRVFHYYITVLDTIAKQLCISLAHDMGMALLVVNVVRNVLNVIHNCLKQVIKSQFSDIMKNINDIMNDIVNDKEGMHRPDGLLVLYFCLVPLQAEDNQPLLK